MQVIQLLMLSGIWYTHSKAILILYKSEVLLLCPSDQQLPVRVVGTGERSETAGQKPQPGRRQTGRLIALIQEILWKRLRPQRNLDGEVAFVLALRQIHPVTDHRLAVTLQI